MILRLFNKLADGIVGFFAAIENFYYWLMRKRLSILALICRLRGHKGIPDGGAIYCLRCRRYIWLRGR